MVSNYFQPESLEEALKLLKRHGKNAKVLAGGTDLVPLLKRKEIAPEYIISINSVPGLKYIERDGDGLKIGAGATYADLLSSSVVRERYPALVDAARDVAAVQVRNLGTIGGNLCHAAPSADMAPPLIVLAAKAEIAGPRGGRTLPLEDFFRGPNRTVLKNNEMLVAIHVPAPGAGFGAAYLKLGARRAMEIALVGVAASVRLKDGLCQEARIALGAVAPKPIRAIKAEQVLVGKGLSSEVIEEAAAQAAKEAKPISDVRCSADYRKQMVRVLARRALNKAWERAKGKG